MNESRSATRKPLVKFPGCPAAQSQAYQRPLKPVRRRGALLLAKFAAMLLASGLGLAAYGQYPGQLHVKAKAPVLRSIAVVEWTGPETTPTASRIIPIAVYDGQDFQPGGLYLARPAPLALYSGTEYFLEDAGQRRGIYDVDTAQQIQGYWYGYGEWKSLAPAEKQNAAQREPPSKSAVPGRPQMRYDSSSGSGSSAPEAGGAQQKTSPPASDQPAPQTAKQPAATAPDRPVLRRRAQAPAQNGNGGTGGFLPPGPETDVGGIPGRPHLSYGSKNPTDTNYELPKLTGTPEDLHQMIAVSDAVNREQQSFVYSWANPNDAAKMKAEMEKLAIADLSPHAVATKSLGRHKAAAAHPRTPGRAARHRVHEEEPAPAFTHEQFQAYALTYNGGATLVFSATTEEPPGKRRYITLIAQPDFYGVPQVIFRSISSDSSLDETPVMKLVDAVDAEGNHRGDLVFELRRRSNREFGIYRVVHGQMQQLFNTGPLSVG